MEIIFVSITAALFIIQLLYFIILYNAVARDNQSSAKGKKEFAESYPPLSVVICANDQEENLRANLPLILNQDYPDFEVIVINDDSTDDTKELLTLLSTQYNNLYHSFTSQSARYISRKKLAVTLGIKACKNEWIVFTEPFCKPTSDQWLKSMARNFLPETDIVLGYSNYVSQKGERNRFISFDVLYTSLRWMGYALLKKPFIGSGNNLAYRKSLFLNGKGFASHLNLLRGEDSLFINKFSNKHNTRVETSANAMMLIDCWNNTRNWKEEKLNQLVVGKYLKGFQKYMLGFETLTKYLFQIMSVVGTVYGIMNANIAMIVLFPTMWLIRYVVMVLVINNNGKKLGNLQQYYLSLPFFDLITPIRTQFLKTKLLFTGRKDYMRKE